MSLDERRRAVVAWLGEGTINVFGRPFSGKDTQCRRLGRWLDAPVLGGGDILRKRDDLPPHIAEYLKRGELIPVSDYLKIVTPYLGQDDFAGRPLVLSSVGRYFGEEGSILQATEAAGHPIRAVVELNLSEDQLWDRWHASEEPLDRGERTDDTTETIKVRLQEFDKKTQPVLDFYRSQGLLVEVDGGGTADEVENLVLDALYDRAMRAQG